MEGVNRLVGRAVLLVALLGVVQGSMAPDSAGISPPMPGFQKDDCDLVADGAVCLNGGKKVLLPNAVPKNLAGHWTFDEVKAVDSSGAGNHAKYAIAAGPGQGGSGSSALFNGFDWVEIPHSASFGDNKAFSITFWLFLYKDPAVAVRHGARWCPIVHKGGSNDEKSPQLAINTGTRQLRFGTTTKSAQFPEGESTLSYARTPVQRWVHVGLVRDGNQNRLFVNGILDASNTTIAEGKTNTGSLFIGGAPWLKDACHVSSYIDELRWYNRALTEEEIGAEAAPALGGVEPSFARLGCLSCPLKVAGESCAEGYHLCTAMELHTGGYQVARLMGYADWHSHVWSHGAYAKATGGKADKGVSAAAAEMAFASVHAGQKLGLGLCCSDFR